MTRLQAADRDLLQVAFEELVERPFPEHAAGDELASWLVDLLDVDGYLAGLATTALASSVGDRVESSAAAKHAARLRAIDPTDGDEAAYDQAARYIEALVALERALAGRA